MANIEYAVNSVADPTSATIVIYVAAGTYTLNSNAIDINRNFVNLTIQGESADTTIVQAALSVNTATDRVFYIYWSETVTLKNMTIRYGKVTTTGGAGIYSYYSNVILENCMIDSNYAIARGDVHGGGVYIGYGAGNSFTMTNCQISNNRLEATGGTEYGGGLYVENITAIITNSTINNNYSDAHYGGIGIYYCTARITNSTIAYNQARISTGGLSVIGTSTVHLTNTVIAYNADGRSYDGMYARGFSSSDKPTVYIKNCLMANNAGRDFSRDRFATIFNNGYNLVESQSHSNFANGVNGCITGDQAGLNLSNTLAGNGTMNGTQTLALLAGSVAINAGDTAANNQVAIPATDQRGMSRVGAPDMGAFEYQCSVDGECDDGNECTDDSCDPASGCVNANNTAPCDDGDACTTGDSCSGGTCQPGTPVVCNDSNLCTDDSCDPASGCVYANNTAPCDDGDACTENDTCASGVCVSGSARDCDDSIACTEDSCDPAPGCQDEPIHSLCDDSDVCTDDACAVGVGCEHTDIVYTISLSPDLLALRGAGAQGIVTATVRDTRGMVKVEGVGVGFSERFDPDNAIELVPMAALAGDGEAAVAIHGLDMGSGELTLQALDENGDEIPGALCLPDSPDDACAEIAGTTLEITSLPCDTTVAVRCADGADPVAGYLMARIEPATAAAVAARPVTDARGEARVLVTARAKGSATVQAHVICCVTMGEATVTVTECADDEDCSFLDDQCNAGVCNPDTRACEKDPSPKEGFPCDDGLFCSGTDICSGGSCASSGNPCNEGAVCNEETDTCDATGCSIDDDCTDGNICNGLESCVAHQCVAGAPLVCDDGDVCNGIETCDITLGCRSGTPLACDDTNPCTEDSCEPETGCRYTDLDDGTSCDDGLFCNGADACREGLCEHAGNPCPNGTTCDESQDRCICASTTTTTICPTTTTTVPAVNCSVVIAPDTQTIESGGIFEFTAATICDGSLVEGTYVWEIMPASAIGSLIDEATGLFTAGANHTGADVIETIQVTDIVHGASDTAEAVVIPLQAECETVINPSAATVNSGGSIKFNASTVGTGCFEPDFEWQIDTELHSRITAGGASCIYQAGVNTTEMLHTDTITVVDRANDTTAHAAVTVSYGRIVRLFPRKLFGSRWIPLPRILYIAGDNTGFNSTSQPYFAPADAVTTIGKVGCGNFMVVVLLVSPNANEGPIGLAVTTLNGYGQEVTFTKEDAFSIRLLPFALDEQENKPH